MLKQVVAVVEDVHVAAHGVTLEVGQDHGAQAGGE